MTDVPYGAVLYPHAELRAGDYSDLDGAAFVMITARANEKTDGATDRKGFRSPRTTRNMASRCLCRASSDAAAWPGSSSRRCPTRSVKRYNAALIGFNPRRQGCNLGRPERECGCHPVITNFDRSLLGRAAIRPHVHRDSSTEAAIIQSTVTASNGQVYIRGESTR